VELGLKRKEPGETSVEADFRGRAAGSLRRSMLMEGGAPRVGSGPGKVTAICLCTRLSGWRLSLDP
jgi:hypothetical protein